MSEPVGAWPYPGIPDDLGGVQCLITGASKGIGLATARGLAQMGARVVLACRDAKSGSAAVTDVNRVARLEADFLAVDLASQRSIHRFASEYSGRFPPPRILIHNAGKVTTQRSLTEDGIETQFAINHLAPFLITHLLLSGIRSVAPSRIVVVASQVERNGAIDFDNLLGERSFDSMAAYRQSKLANVMFTYSLAERLQGSGVTANCLHPGVVRTALLDDIGKVETARAAPQGMVARSLSQLDSSLRGVARSILGRKSQSDWALNAEEGARTTLYVATAPELANVSGKFFREMQQAPSSPQSLNRETRERLWEVSARLTKINGASYGGA